MVSQKKLQLSLLLLRTSVFLVMLMWTVDKFINPIHATKVYEKFYFIVGLETEVMYVLAVIEIMILILFISGCYKKYTYAAILFFHAISTLSSFKQYLSPYEGVNLLFFTAWPMLAACIVLFLLKEQDILLSYRKIKYISD